MRRARDWRPAGACPRDVAPRAPARGRLATASAATALLAVVALLAAAPRAVTAPRFAPEAVRVERVLALENERLGLMPAVAAWKWTHHAPVTDAARERAIIEDTARLARPLGLETAPVENLFELQMQLARGVEAARLQAWRRHGFRYAGAVPDLRRELRPRLDRLTRSLLRALYLAAPAFSRPDFATRYAAAAARDLSAEGWTPRHRGELLDALQRIRLVPAPGATALARIRNAGVLRIGTTGDYAPFSAEHDGRLSGVDIDLARSLARARARCAAGVRAHLVAAAAR